MWPGASRSFNYNFPPHHHDIFVVAPASSFHHHNDAVLSDPNNHNNHNGSTHALGVGVNVIPLLTAACGEGQGITVNSNSNGNSNRVQLWQDHESQQNYLKISWNNNNNNNNTNNNENSGGSGGEGNLVQCGLSGSVSNGGGATCQDCGNQAKKNCSHRRCRTCCKSRGYDCPTHVRSTWVPAARRRERQLMAAPAVGSSGSSSAAKKPRLVVASQTNTTNSHTSTSNTTTPRSFDTGSSHQDASLKDSLPNQLRAPAVFKCVRVTAVNDGEDEFAYQAVVKIGGHVFKGLLYDKGVEDRDIGEGGYPNISELHLGGRGGNAGKNGVSSSSPVLDNHASNVYAASGGGLLGASSNYGNPVN